METPTAAAATAKRQGNRVVMPMAASAVGEPATDCGFHLPVPRGGVAIQTLGYLTPTNFGKSFDKSPFIDAHN
jgi:hypothetical protein